METFQHPHEGVDVLSAGNRPLTVEHVGRNAGDPQIGGLVQLGGDLGATFVGVETSTDLGGVETGETGPLGDHLGITHVFALHEIGLEEMLFQPGLIGSGILLGHPQRPMGEQGVGAPSPVQTQFEAIGLGHRSEMVHDASRRVLPAELAGVSPHRRGGRARRGAGIELIGAIRDLDLGSLGMSGAEALERGVEAVLADEAPRTHHIGPDLDLHGLHRRPLACTTMTRTPPSPEAVQATFCAVIVDAFVACGVRHVVIAPGSRSTPLALALADREDLEIQIAHDERTAAFMALGVGLATGRPAIALCTSGTAAVHFHAAVVEAHLSGVPLVVITADRPPELHGVGAAQTIDQRALYGSALRLFADPGVPDVAAVRSWRSLGERVVTASIGARPGPVQLNVAFREPLVGEVDPELYEQAGSTTPNSRIGVTRLAPGDLGFLVDLVAHQVRGVIVAGRSEADPDAVAALAAALGWPVLADHRSRCRHLDAAVTTFDTLIRDEAFARDHRPDVVIRLGEPLASKVTTQWLRSANATEIHLQGRGGVIDPDHTVAHRIVADPTDTLEGWARGIGVGAAVTTPWLARWRQAEIRVRERLDAWFAGRDDLDEPLTARTVVAALPAESHLVVASSMPVRDVEWFAPARGDVTVYSNRGANGIDGVLATAIGVAFATREPTAVLIGDVALLHDSSSLVALANRGLDVRIVVIDNDGGGIFSFLPQAATLDSSRFETLFATPHGTDLELLARAHRLATRTVTTPRDLAATLGSPGPSLIRVRTDRQRNVVDHAEAHRAGS